MTQMPAENPSTIIRRVRSLFKVRRPVRDIALAALLAGGALWSHACVSGEGAYGPYGVIGYNYTDRHISSFIVNGFAAGASHAHESGGGGGIVCCLEIPKSTKSLHIKVELDLTREQFVKDLPGDTFETDIPVPQLKNKRDGYIEFHFLPHQKIEASWVKFPTTPDIPNAH